MKIKATENGPYLIEVTDVTVRRDDNVEVVTQKMVALCRCGASANKPFCDGSHKQCEFKGDTLEIELN